MSDLFGHVERMWDIAVNGRKADSSVLDPAAAGMKAPISMVELIERKTSVVRCGQKMYSVTVAEIGAGK